MSKLLQLSILSGHLLYNVFLLFYIVVFFELLFIFYFLLIHFTFCLLPPSLSPHPHPLFPSHLSAWASHSKSCHHGPVLFSSFLFFLLQFSFSHFFTSYLFPLAIKKIKPFGVNTPATLVPNLIWNRREHSGKLACFVCNKRISTVMIMSFLLRILTGL